MHKTVSGSQSDEILQTIKDFRLLDDIFMSKCFEDNEECTELLLNIILGRQDLRVQKTNSQYTIKNLQGRSLVLDIFAVDNKGKRYDIEVQRKDEGAGAKRARYHSSVVDANVLEAGTTFEVLPDTYVIFITENDVLGGNLAVYHIERYVAETGREFGDSSHIIYVNGAYRDDTPIGRLMHDFSCTKPDDMYYSELAERTRYFKEKEGVAEMSSIVEEISERGRLRGREEGMQEGIQQGIQFIVFRMLESDSVSYEDIAKYSGLSVEEVKSLKKL